MINTWRCWDVQHPRVFTDSFLLVDRNGQAGEIVASTKSELFRNSLWTLMSPSWGGGGRCARSQSGKGGQMSGRDHQAKSERTCHNGCSVSVSSGLHPTCPHLSRHPQTYKSGDWRLIFHQFVSCNINNISDMKVKKSQSIARLQPLTCCVFRQLLIVAPLLLAVALAADYSYPKPAVPYQPPAASPPANNYPRPPTQASSSYPKPSYSEQAYASEPKPSYPSYPKPAEPSYQQPVS